MNKITFNVDASKTKGTVSETLFGLFLEDINYSCDGGLNANLVQNFSFDDVYLKKFKVNDFDFILGKVGKLETQPDYLRYWNCDGGILESEDANPVAPDTRYAKVTCKNKCTLENAGYRGRAEVDCGMAVSKGEDYQFSAYLRNANYQGKVLISLRDSTNRLLTNELPITVPNNWTQQTLTLTSNETGLGKLVISFDGIGCVELDSVSLIHADYWGKNNPKWSQGKLRKDLVESLSELKPKFLRFPGGCIIEGLDIGNEYHWKDSVGPIISRKQDYNLWAYEEKEFECIQSRQIGFYEYFLLCEDLNMEPLPVVWAGMNCQMRKRPAIDINSPEFEEQVVQNALDLIEYANGDPAVSAWARLRAEAGHPEPFNMRFIGIGNENFGPDYLARFRKVKAAIDKKYKNITCILGSGSAPDGKDFSYSWEQAKRNLQDVYIDEHFYKNPKWVIKQQGRYDSYERNGPKVFLGEYAAYDVVAGMLKKSFVPNRYDTALAEAAFLTGIERNADVVAMTCYAPLFALAEGEHWKHNLIFFNGQYVMRTVNYYVQKMFGTTVEKEIVCVPDALPKGVYSSATRSDNKLCLKFVNTTSNSFDLRINVQNFDGTEAVITQMSCNNLKERHTLSFLGEPVETVVPQTTNCTLRAETELKLDKYSIMVIQLAK